MSVTKERAIARCRNIARKLAAVEAAHPDSPEVAALHRLLASTASLAAEHFEAPVAAFSGGQDKPPIDPNDPGDDEGSDEGGGEGEG